MFQHLEGVPAQLNIGDYLKKAGLAIMSSPPPRNNTNLWRFSQELGEAAKYLKGARVHHAAGYLMTAAGDAKGVW